MKCIADALFTLVLCPPEDIAIRRVGWFNR